MTTYISIDIEADGPIPGSYSMMSLGAAAFQLDNNDPGWKMIATFKHNLLPLPSAQRDPDTMKWWGKQGPAWERATVGAIDPGQAMNEFVAWCKALPGPLVLAGYPITYDFQFVYWYTVMFTGYPTPFGFQGLDIKTLAFDRMGCSFKDAAKRNMPKRWFRNAPPHTHDALDDAIGQGILLMNILNDEAP